MSDDPVRLIDAPETPAFLSDLVRSLEPPAIPPTVRERALARLEPKERSRPGRITPWLLAAAAVLLGVAISALLAGVRTSELAGKIVDDAAPRARAAEELAEGGPQSPDEVLIGQPPAPPDREPIERVAAWADGGVDGSVARGNVVRECVAASNYAVCVIRGLEGHPNLSAHELMALIESYRSLGNEAAALRHMQAFVSRFPTERQTHQYSQILVRNGRPGPTDAFPPRFDRAARSDRVGSTPSREEVVAGARSVADLVEACGDGPGVVRVTFTIEGATGRVADASVTGQYAGTAIAECAERAIRTARFPTFGRQRFQVSVPYHL